MMVRSGCPSLHGLTTGTHRSSGATIPATHPANPVMACIPSTSTGTRSGALHRLAPSLTRSATPMADRTSASRATRAFEAESHRSARALLRSVVLRVDFIERKACLSKLIIPRWPVSTGAATLPAAQAPADITIVEDGTRPSYMTCKDTRTMQHPALSTKAVDAAEALEDEFAARAADGVICGDDIAYLRPMIQLVVVKTQKTDLATMAGLALIRGGKDSQRASRLLREVETFMPAEAA